jgi:hypothetical protein
MNILLIVIAIALVSVPVTAVALVSIAVFREESLHSLTDRAPGGLARSARRLLAVHAEGSCRPIDRARVRNAFDLQYRPAFPSEPAGSYQPVIAYQPEAPHEPAVFREPVAAAAVSSWISGR